MELAAQEAAFWEAEREAIAAEDAEEHMAAIEWRSKQAAAARARDVAADALEQVRALTQDSTGFGHHACDPGSGESARHLSAAFSTHSPKMFADYKVFRRLMRCEPGAVQIASTVFQDTLRCSSHGD